MAKHLKKIILNFTKIKIFVDNFIILKYLIINWNGLWKMDILPHKSKTRALIITFTF